MLTPSVAALKNHLIHLNTVRCYSVSSADETQLSKKHPVRVVFFGYADTSQITCLQLMAKKKAVAQSTSGDVPESGLDSLNQDEDSVEMVLARRLVNV